MTRLGVGTTLCGFSVVRVLRTAHQSLDLDAGAADLTAQIRKRRGGGYHIDFGLGEARCQQHARREQRDR
jgi:hypothetical protein